MTVTLPDPLKAVCAFLRAEVGHLLDPIPGGLSGLPAGVPAVFRPDLPQAIDPAMPMASIVVRPAGGYRMFGDSMLQVADPRIDIICFGSTQTQSWEVAQNVAYQLQQTGQKPQEWEGCWIYSIVVNAGPVPLPDAQTLWPATWLGATMMHGQLPAS